MVRVLTVLTMMAATGGSAAQPEPGSSAPVHSPEYKTSLLALRDRLRKPASPVTEREQRECLDWMLKANPAIKRTLVGHHVIVLATDQFAERAAQNEFVVVLDLSYEVLRSLWGNDPCARVGRRFFVWPDHEKGGGHSCNGRELRIHVGRADWNNADWFERYFHEMTHGFQFEHPAGSLMVNGFFEGWAEFMQAAVCDHLAPLGVPFVGRLEWYRRHFPEVSRREYLQTRLPIEEIVAYDPSAGVLMELLGTTRDTAGRVDWGPVRKLLHDPVESPRWVPWHLWPAQMASECMEAFGEAKARPILDQYRFPVDGPSLAGVAAMKSPGARPATTERRTVEEWVVLGPMGNPTGLGLERDPLDAEHMAWWWAQKGGGDPSIDGHWAGLGWRRAGSDRTRAVQLDGREGAAAYFYLVATLPESARRPLTLFISSDDECAVWLDGELVHLFRGNRACAPDYPDVAYADATGSKGQIVVLVVNHGGPAAFSMALAHGGLLFEGFEGRFGSADTRERAGAVRYAASRRHRQPVMRMLEQAAMDPEAAVRRAAAWWPVHVPRDARADYAEAEDAYFRGSIRGGFFGNSPGSSGNQCVARGWGGDASNWLSLPLEARTDGPQRVRIRYACPNDATLRVRVRRGDRVVFMSEPERLRPSGKDWHTWAWHEVATPRLERGIYHVELIEPAGLPDIDVIGLAGH